MRPHFEQGPRSHPFLSSIPSFLLSRVRVSFPLTLVFLFSRWLVNPNMMSESTKIVPRSMTLGLGFSSPGAPCEFGRAMLAAGAAKKTLHSKGDLFHLSIHQYDTSRTHSVHPLGLLIRTFGGSRGLLARVRKTTHRVSSSPRGKRDNPAGTQKHLDPPKTLSKPSWSWRAAAGLSANEERLARLLRTDLQPFSSSPSPSFPLSLY